MVSFQFRVSSSQTLKFTEATVTLRDRPEDSLQDLPGTREQLVAGTLSPGLWRPLGSPDLSHFQCHFILLGCISTWGMDVDI